MTMNSSQPPLFDINEVIPPFVHTSFSHNNVCQDSERLRLEEKYSPFFIQDDRFNRKIVSFQANKGELVHSWLKYREGFSSTLVETLLNDFKLEIGDTVFDPFAGSATTLLVSKTLGLNAKGMEILPNCHLAWEAKSRFSDYDVEELQSIYSKLVSSTPSHTKKSFPHITITESAFSPETENDIMWYTDWFGNMDISDDAKSLCKLILTSILEQVSYTRKDGQYLRWDYRSEKIISRNKKRLSQGKKPINGIDKGKLPIVKDTLLKTFLEVISDIETLQARFAKNGSCQSLIHGNSLLSLPQIPQNTFAAVITSPPYANRYDYTRTYALEICYLGYGKKIKELRQSLLSCTVESKSKFSLLQEYYQTIGEADRYQYILSKIKTNPALNEINLALQTRWERKDLNNKGIISMINQYFSELAFIFAELFKTCKPGAKVAFVNDDVRYGGEIIPVDTITSNLAESFGFKTDKIIVLAQKKGNSSQQMKKFGREEMRKCITIWQKPN